MSTRLPLAAVVALAAALAPALEIRGAAAGQKPKGTASTTTVLKLPSLGSNAEAHGINDAGTVVVGHSFDRAGYLYAVKWTLHNGAWTISVLPYPGSAIARSIDNQGNVVGYGATSPRRAVFWPAEGGYTVLGCDDDVAEAHAIGDALQVVGHSGGRAAVWQAPQSCAEHLPPLEEGAFASATGVSADGSIIGGRAFRTAEQSSAAVRWTGAQGARQIEQLDPRPGSARRANATGDLAGHLTVPCALADGCQRGVIWYVAGGSLQLGTLGGAHSWIQDINVSGEVVGLSTSTGGTNTAFFWSPARGMVQLPANRWGAANAMSDVRADGTRLAAGTDSQANAVVWIIR